MLCYHVIDTFANTASEIVLSHTVTYHAFDFRLLALDFIVLHVRFFLSPSHSASMSIFVLADGLTNAFVVFLIKNAIQRQLRCMRLLEMIESQSNSKTWSLLTTYLEQL